MYKIKTRKWKWRLTRQHGAVHTCSCFSINCLINPNNYFPFKNISCSYLFKFTPPCFLAEIWGSEKKSICWFFCSLASNILFSVLFFCFLSVLEIGPSWCHTGHCHFSNGRDGSIGPSPPLWQHIVLDSVLAGGWEQRAKGCFTRKSFFFFFLDNCASAAQKSGWKKEEAARSVLLLRLIFLFHF